jgi:DNA repair exonuclease SbcCD ATPase subunit/DNA repair exonuclease SbcCD nuclease subunit
MNIIPTMKKIIHISDIHIRNGNKEVSRYDEYTTVFDNLFTSIKTNIEFYDLTPEDFVIILTGDIFHNKNVVGNYGLELYNKLVKGLTTLGHTIIFHGNHDRNQSEISQPSLISSTIEHGNLTILKHTQSFIINNIGFSYVSIDDTLDPLSTCGRTNVLPSFPAIEKCSDKSQKIDKTVALFHGTFGNVRLYNGTQIDNTTNPYPLEWISTFDFALLGDIHLRQSSRYGNVLWGYSGSLIQQNYGEDIVDHGYMIWNLDDNTIDEINVFNPRGYINIMVKDDEIYVRKNGKYLETLSDTIEKNADYFPKILDIRSYSAFTSKNTVDLYSILNKNGIEIYNFNKKVIKATQNNNEDLICKDIEVIHINKDTFISYLAKYIPKEYYGKAEQIIKKSEILLFDIENCPEELVEECLKKNKEIAALINACSNNDSSTNKKAFTIEYLEWENLYCYESGNSIHFAEALNNTLLICGNNGTGKSAIYDIITLSIWGSITKDKQNTLTKNGIINYKHRKAYVLIDISINEEKYRIRRHFELIKDKGVEKVKNTVEIFKYEGEITNSIKKNNACNEFIKDKFGTLDDFLTCSMITQVVDNDILRIDYKDCTAIIDKASNINEIYDLFNLFKVCLNKYNDYRKTIENKKQVYEHIIASSHIDNVIDDELSKELLLHENLYIDLMNQNNNIAIDEYDSKYKDIMDKEKDTFALSGHYESDSDSFLIDWMSVDQYNKKVCRFNEIKSILKNMDEATIREYADKYIGESRESAEVVAVGAVGDVVEINKPCEFSIIKEERLSLKAYNNPNVNMNYNKNNTLEFLEDRYNTITRKINELIDKKPSYINTNVKDTVLRNIDDIERDINIIFDRNDIEGSLKLLKECNLNSEKYTRSHISHISTITYQSYKELLKLQDILIEDIEVSRNNQMINDEKIVALYKKKSEIVYFNKPNVLLYDEDYVYNLELREGCEAGEAGEAGEADESDEYLNAAISEYEEILNSYYSSLGKINDVEKNIKKNEGELRAIKNNDDYDYDPCCKYCINRSWVKKIKLLEINILQGYELLDTLNHELYERDDLDYMYIYNEYTRMGEELKRRENYKLWQDYNNYLREDGKIANDISAILENINIEKESYKTNTHKLSIVLSDINKFICDTSTIYKEYENLIAHKRYNVWKKRYDNSLEEKATIEEEIKIAKYYIEYDTHIKPRKEKLKILEEKYMVWKAYDTNHKILLANEYVNLKIDIQKQDNINSMKINREIVKTVKRKRKILEDISRCSDNIKRITGDIAKNKMLASYNLKNTTCYEYYKKEHEKIVDVTTILEIIIDNFKTYRIDLYENHILKNLMNKTNNYIKSLCHKDTKEFGLDFIISETRDIIHINWLIHNSTDSDNIKQTISINQASGFQRFVISLALRMSLYSNTRTEQIFIDEGFTACDKQNLSLVPGFLKSLLNTFQGVVIVSHIDVIKDSVDIIANIEYNSKTKTSYIKYAI